MIVLTKSFSRECSLFYCYVWHENNRKYSLIANVRNLLFLKESKENIVSFWYDPSELQKFDRILQKKIISYPKYFTHAKKLYLYYSNLLRPYVTGKKKIKSLNELEWFYNTWIAWWSPLAVIFLLSNIEGAPIRIRKEALRLRAKTQEYPDTCDKAFRAFFQKHYPKYKHLAFIITPYEAFSLRRKRLTSGEVRKIQKRMNGWALFNGQLLLREALTKKLKAQNVVLEKPSRTKFVSKLHGVGASKGRAIGKVRIILLEREVMKLKAGEVLVTTMTSPAFLPAMRVAAAIVTDEGSIASHAAIVSRELEIPCVIGTKVATKVLKDGDYVEVDANRGVVRILKRK